MVDGELLKFRSRMGGEGCRLLHLVHWKRQIWTGRPRDIVTCNKSPGRS